MFYVLFLIKSFLMPYCNGYMKGILNLMQFLFFYFQRTTMFDITSILVNSFESQLLKIVKNLYLETKSYRHKIIWEPFYVCWNSRCLSTSLRL